MPPGRPKQFDADAALDAVTAILWREGVRGVSLNEIARLAGVSKPLLAQAFGGKDAMVARALERYYEDIGRRGAAALDRAGDGVAAVAAYLGVFVDSFTDPKTPPGCLLASATCDCATVGQGPVREAIDRLNARGHAALVRRLSRAGAPAPEDLARFVAGQTVALSVLSRTGADRPALERFVGHALAAVRAALSASGTRAPHGTPPDGQAARTPQ